MNRPRIPKGRIPKGVLSRQNALKCLRDVASGAFVQASMQTHVESSLSPSDRRLVREMVMGVLRHQTWLDEHIKPHLKGALTELDPPVLEAIRLGVFQGGRQV